MKIRYFAWLRQRTGCSQEEVELPQDVATVADLMAWVGERHPRFSEACEAKGVVRCALNQEYVERDAPVSDGDEIAFFPPVTGG
ncbi:MAG: molybdopterin converting factor subunit 1 [Geminicoccaceae bacterium]|nr:molybdopterin converting factor subunit 1 [Geminicoccaceae bacterium]MCB9943755.1 molybdopterin converting factor subunit 1 [Geminicoccaceae bacterium]